MQRAWRAAAGAGLKVKNFVPNLRLCMAYSLQMSTCGRLHWSAARRAQSFTSACCGGISRFHGYAVSEVRHPTQPHPTRLPYRSSSNCPLKVVQLRLGHHLSHCFVASLI